MSKNRSSILGSLLSGMGRWFANMLGICAIAGGLGTGAGLFMGLPFVWALACGGAAIVLVLALYLFLMSGGDL